MILSIIAATAAAGVIYAGENAAQRGITKIVTARKAAKAGYVPATAYPTIPQPMLPPPPPMMQQPIMPQAAADAAAAQQAAMAAEAAAPAAAPTTQPVNLDQMFNKIVDLVDTKLTAIAAQPAPAAPAQPAESGCPYTIKEKVAVIGDFNDAGVRVDLDGKEISDFEKVGSIHSIIDPVTVVVTLKKKGKTEYDNRRFTIEMLGTI